jgi:16S rRNA processing protein RimM
LKGGKRICLGAFAGAHGVRGEAKVKCFTEAPHNIAAYGRLTSEDGRRSFSLEVVRVLKPDLVVARAPEIASREDAQSLAGTRLYVDRAALPETDEDEFYFEDLVGLAAFTEDGAPAGRVAAVHNFGAGDILELDNVPGRKESTLIAFTRTLVPDIDLAAGRLTIAAAALAEEADETSLPSLSDDTGEIVSDDISVDLDAMREEDA